jgi:apolipoprotein N-acyltransferase
MYFFYDLCVKLTILINILTKIIFAVCSAQSMIKKSNYDTTVNITFKNKKIPTDSKYKKPQSNHTVGMYHKQIHDHHLCESIPKVFSKNLGKLNLYKHFFFKVINFFFCIF